jgi:hypothetical protein
MTKHKASPYHPYIYKGNLYYCMTNHKASPYQIKDKTIKYIKQEGILIL